MTTRSPVASLVLALGLGLAFSCCARASSAAEDSTRTATLALPPVKVGGYLQIDYRQTFHRGSPHDLNARRARVSFTGRAHERVGFNLGLQGDRPGGSSAFSVLDLVATVDPGGGFKLRIGQFKYEFDIEGREGDENYLLIDRSWAANTVAGGMNGLSEPSTPSGSFRDRGIEVARAVDAAGWRLEGVAGGYQGAGRSADNNNDFGYAVRARASRSGLTLHYGWMSSPSDAALTGHYLYSAWTAGLDHVWRWSHLRAELYEGQLDFGSTDLENQGGYVLELVRLHPRFDVSARWQSVRIENFGDLRHAGAVDVGGRAYLLRNGTRTNTWIALGYMVREAAYPVNQLLTDLNDGTGDRGISPERRRHLVVARFQVAF